jgi:hypothetical protein
VIDLELDVERVGRGPKAKQHPYSEIVDRDLC